MMRDWKLGDAALIEEGCHADRKVAIRSGSKSNPGWAYLTDQGMTKWTSDSADVITVVRPLVILDLPDGAKAGWPALLDALKRARETTGLTMVFGGLIEQVEAQTTSKPAEPTGLGAVVEDATGARFVLYTDPDSHAPWCDGSTSMDYADIAAVRVISQGVAE